MPDSHAHHYSAAARRDRADPAKLGAVSELLTLGNLIGGRIVAPRHGAYLDVFEPATGAVFARCPDSDASDVDDAVAAAKRAASGWAATPAEERARLLNRLADLVERDLDALAALESRDAGKTVKLAQIARHPARGLEPALLRRCDHAMAERSASDGRPRAELHAAPAARRRRVHLAVEPAAVSFHLEDRAGACGRQRGRRQAVARSRRAPLRASASFRSKPDFRRACSTSCRAPDPASASRWSSTPDVKAISFTGSDARPARRSPRPPRRSSRNFRSSSAARIRRSCSPISISAMRTSTRSCAPASRTRARSVSAARACSCSARSTSDFKERYLDASARASRRRSGRCRDRSRRARLEAALRQSRRLHRAREVPKAAAC